MQCLKPETRLQILHFKKTNLFVNKLHPSIYRRKHPYIRSQPVSPSPQKLTCASFGSCPFVPFVVKQKGNHESTPKTVLRNRDSGRRKTRPILRKIMCLIRKNICLIGWIMCLVRKATTGRAIRMVIMQNATLPQNLRTSELQNLRTSEPQNFRTSEPQNLRTSEPQNLRTSEPQNLRTSELQNKKTSGPQKRFHPFWIIGERLVAPVWRVPGALVLVAELTAVRSVNSLVAINLKRSCNNAFEHQFLCAHCGSDICLFHNRNY